MNLTLPSMVFAGFVAITTYIVHVTVEKLIGETRTFYRNLGQNMWQKTCFLLQKGGVPPFSMLESIVNFLRLS